MHHYVKLAIKIALLTLFLAALYAIDFVSLQLSETVRTAPFMLLLMALLDTAVDNSHPSRSEDWMEAGWDYRPAVFRGKDLGCGP